ncbi:MAG TPA: YXWGXW repeat-containing protein [Candidatus Dormibacteraeota bacterium]|nr:YXWGXW repeat-containing protein [Candidatus Dormibacteraeota bacterium]
MNRSIIRWVFCSLAILSLSAASFGQIAVGVSVRFGPPALPVYAQPICPGPGYLWTPGYWAWNDDGGYYWVPGTWVMAPVGMLWTPGYWGWGGGFYAWHPGYWGPHVGFYGGINYGFGYGGVGFVGGEWRGGGFYYNRYVTNVSVTSVTNVYNRTVVVNNTTTTSFNGGTGGVTARPTSQEEAYSRENHTPALAAQSQHEHSAAQNRQNFASENHGRPAIAATTRPGDFSGHSVVPARASGGEYHAPAMSPKEARVGSSAGNGGNKGSNEGFRPFTPPAKNNSSTASERNNSNSGRGNETRNNETRINGSRNNESRPQNQPHGGSPHQEPPRQNQHKSSPPPPPHRPSPPPKESHHGKGR